jgi:hypothetical protein
MCLLVVRGLTGRGRDGGDCALRIEVVVRSLWSSSLALKDERIKY